jgi:SAM-dependent methyltransferase
MDNHSSADEIRLFYAQTYDASVPDWPGEIDFYRQLARKATENGQPVLELACGTGRVALQLAKGGARVTGLDLSTQMLSVARVKSAGMANVDWVEGDMRSFDLGVTFGLIIIPGHAFQNILTPDDQLSCLQSTKRHLAADGVLVVHLDHQDVDWLGGLMGDKGGALEPEETFTHPVDGRRVQALRAWWYERFTQTAIVQTIWDVFDDEGSLARRIESSPVRLHCVFRFEFEHLLGRVGFKNTAVFGDFFENSLSDESSEMVWLAAG